MNKNAKMRWPSIGKCTVPSDYTPVYRGKKLWDISREDLEKAIDEYEAVGGTTTQLVIDADREFIPMGSIAGIIGDLGGKETVRTKNYHRVVGFDPFK